MSKPCTKTYAWFAKPNSGEYRKIERTAHEQERDCFALYAGITVRSTDERFSGGYKFRYHNLLDRDLNYPEGGKYTIRKREINLVSTKRISGNYNAKINGRWYGLGDTFMEQLYINAVRKAADYLKKKNIKAKVGNISDPANAHHSLFVQWCDDYNNGCDYDREVYNKIIKEVTAYHEEAYLKSDEQSRKGDDALSAAEIRAFKKHEEDMFCAEAYLKSDKQNSYDAQLRETYKEAAADICREIIDAAQRAVEAAGNSLDKMDELLKENEKLKEEKDKMEYEYLFTIGKLMAALDEEGLKKFMENDLETARLAFGALVNERGARRTVREFLNNCRKWENKE